MDVSQRHKILAALACLAGFVPVLLLTYLGYIMLFQVDVVFYSAIAAGLLAAGLMAVVVLRLRVFSPLEKGLLVLCMVLVSYIHAITGPALIDRSLSFYILEKLQQRGGGIQRDQMDHVFSREYMEEHRLIEIRITEQLESGTVRLDGDCVRLTPWGEILASFGQFYRKNLLPRQRLIGDEYTDDLTDPLRAGAEYPDYQC